jgi:hypothetical protein
MESPGRIDLEPNAYLHRLNSYGEFANEKHNCMFAAGSYGQRPTNPASGLQDSINAVLRTQMPSPSLLTFVASKKFGERA